MSAFFRFFLTWWGAFLVGVLDSSLVFFMPFGMLERFVPEKRLERFRARVRNKGAVAVAIPALMPPPFPLTVFTLTSASSSSPS